MGLIFSVVWHVATIIIIVGALPCWRRLSGEVAWKIHTTAKHQKDLKPEIEDWVFAAIVTSVLAPFWPIILFFHKAPESLKGENEREAEKMVSQIKYDRLVLDNERRMKELEMGRED